MKIKTILLILASLPLYCTSVFAQFGVRGSYMSPTGAGAFYFKPAIGYEFYYSKGNITSQFRYNFGFGYHQFKPTMDTFPIYDIEPDGAKRFLTGYQALKSYNVIPVFAGIEYTILESRLSPYVGIDFNFFLIDNENAAYIKYLYDENVTQRTDWQLGMAPKVGVSYRVGDNWVVSIGAAYALGLLGTVDSQNFSKVFGQITYYIYKPELEK